MLQTLFAIPDVSLTTVEVIELARNEEIVERGLNTFVEVGQALMIIRDNHLYRQSYSTFEDYCRERWGIKRQRAYELMDAAKVVGYLSEISDILPIRESHAAPLSTLEPDQQREAWQKAIDTAPDGKITAAHVQSVVDEIKRPVSYHVSDDSYEWYTPAEYIEAARGVMGSIDLDPASCDTAQVTIQAGTYYTKEVDGLKQIWRGNVWLNPPYNMPLVEQFIDRVVSDYQAGVITSAIVLTNNSTDTGWFHKLIRYPVCFTRGRIKFYSGDENLATRQGQAIFYLGDNPDLFAKVFSAFGVVLKQYDD